VSLESCMHIDMDESLLGSTAGTIKRDDAEMAARAYGRTFCRRAVFHIIFWFFIMLGTMKGPEYLSKHGYSKTAIAIKVLFVLLGVYFLMTLHGLYIRWRGQPPVDEEAVRRDGGKIATAFTGRKVEYFVWGSQKPDAMVAVLIHGQAGTGKGYQAFFYPQDVMESLDVKAIAPSLPGHGYTDADNNRRIANWPAEDLDAVLRAENVNQFIVEGWSYGTAHAMATAAYYDADRCLGMGLNCPYLPMFVSREFGMKTDADFVFTERGADSAATAPIYSLLSMFWCLLGNAGYSIKDTKIAVKEEPEVVAAFAADVTRGASRGVSGQVLELTNRETNQVWQDPRSIKTKCVAVWYAEDDTQVHPEDGKWLSDLFEKKAGVKTANKVVNYGWGHFSFVKKEHRGTGIMTKALLDLIRS